MKKCKIVTYLRFSSIWVDWKCETGIYKNEQETQGIFRCLLSIPLLPVDDTVPAFEDVVTVERDDAVKGETAADTAVRGTAEAEEQHDRPCTTVCSRQPDEN